MFKFTKIISISLCVAMLSSYCVNAENNSANSLSSSVYESNYTYNGEIYNVIKTTTSDGEITVNVTSEYDSAVVTLNNSTSIATVTETIIDKSNKNIKNTYNKTIDLTKKKVDNSTVVDESPFDNSTVVDESLVDNSTVVDESPVDNSTVVDENSAENIVQTSNYTASGSVEDLYWDYTACYKVDTDLYGAGNEYYDLYCGDREQGYSNIVQINGDEYDLCSSFYSSVQGILDNEVAAIAAGDGAIVSAVAGVLAGLETVGIATVIGIVLALGGVVAIAYCMFQAYLDAQDANKTFDELMALGG